MNNNELLTIKEVAEILYLTTDQVGQMIDSGQIRFEQVNGKRMVRQNDIPSIPAETDRELPLPLAAKYIGETEETLKEMNKKGWMNGSKKNGVLHFRFKECFQYLHFTKKLKE